MSQNIRLYTTAGCHLCETAEAMLDYVLQNDADLGNYFNYRLVEIAAHEDLMERFGVRIPVLELNDDELSWPFELEDLFKWLNQHFSKDARD